ncbi:MAG: MogA/MoaB family molybdenum cofactor biosynthesis protein [Dehalococcoidales bacterium]|nr:MogA/MoaB family molybdenum cofactor biosynthesis protein [Dehalococcoidales bacterium]
MIKIGVLTISDKGSKGQREDKSGQVIRDSAPAMKGRVVKYEIVPDEKETIAARLRDWADGGEMDVILTTGGTGLAGRDVTPEATLSIIDREVPGIAEAMRVKSLEKTPTAMLSRAVAGQRGKCLIVNLPGSTRAVKECLEAIMPVLPHAVDIIRGKVTEHSLQDAGIN